MRIIIVNGVIIKDHKLLLLKKFSKNYYETPGGKTEKDESIEDCLVRELQEEIGIKVISFTKLLDADTFYFENKEITNHSFLIKEFEEEPRLIERDIFEKLIWIGIKEAKKIPLAPNVKKIVEKLEKN